MSAPTPSRDDDATTRCPACGTGFVPAGRRRFCTDACRKNAYRRRHHPPPPSIALPPRRSAKPGTVYECPTCEARYLGQQRCDECGVFCRRVGPGGLCTHCDEPLALVDLLGEEVTPLG
jgi:hypothetical protein